MRLHAGSATVKMTEGNIWKQLALFALPLLLTNFLQQLYSTCDLLIVGQFIGSGAVAAVGATGSVTNLLINFFLGLGTGSSVVISQLFGAGNREGVSRAVHTALTIAFLSGIFLTIVGVIASPILLEWMGTPADIIEDANIYLRTIFCGIAANLLYNMGAGILRAVGDSRRPLYYLMVSVTGNIVLDLLFVAVFHWGVFGAAFATILSQVVSLVFILLNLLRTDECYHLFWRRLGIDKHMLSQILRVGVPAGLQGVVVSLSNVVVQSAINSFGSTVVAGTAAASRVDGFISMTVSALSLSMMTFAGQNAGARRFDRLSRGVRNGLVMGVGMTAAMGLLLFFFLGEWTLSLFDPNPDTIAVGFRLVRVMASSYWVFAMSEVLSCTMRGTGYSTVPMFVSLTFMCGFRLLYIWIALPIWNDTLTLFLVYPVSYLLTFLTNVALYKSKRWLRHYKKLHPEPAAE